MTVVQVLLLLFVANGAPVVARLLLSEHLSLPVDFGRRFVDGRPLFGNSKTWRGLFAAIILSTLVGLLLGFPFYIGALFGFYVMLGDLIASFIKRRCGIEPSGQALGLDQIPESLLPLLLLKSSLELSWSDIVIAVALFVILELLLSRLLYHLHIRKRPY